MTKDTKDTKDTKQITTSEQLLAELNHDTLNPTEILALRAAASTNAYRCDLCDYSYTHSPEVDDYEPICPTCQSPANSFSGKPANDTSQLIDILSTRVTNLEKLVIILAEALVTHLPNDTATDSDTLAPFSAPKPAPTNKGTPIIHCARCNSRTVSNLLHCEVCANYVIADLKIVGYKAEEA